MRPILFSLLTVLATPAKAEVPRVVTDIPPVHALVAQVMGDLGTPELLLDRGASEHDFQLRPSQAALLAEAGLIVWVGPELTPWLDRVMGSLGEGVPSLALLEAPGTGLRAYTEEEGHDNGAHDHVQEGHEGHDHEGADPHAWLDPGNAQAWLADIAAELGRLDPANADAYAANAEAAGQQIATLDAEVAEILAPVKDRPIVVFHDAYGYFADHYGLTIAAAIAPGDATSPGAARLREIEAELQGAATLCAFPEPQHDAALLTQMAEATGATIGGAIDPVGSSLEPGPGTYAALMRGLAQTIADCAG